MHKNTQKRPSHSVKNRDPVNLVVANTTLVFRAIGFPFDLGVSTWFVAATTEDGTTRVLCAIYGWITPGFWEASRCSPKSAHQHFQHPVTSLDGLRHPVQKDRVLHLGHLWTRCPRMKQQTQGDFQKF